MENFSSELLSDMEACQRRGYFSRDYEPRRLHPTEITRRAIYAALVDPREDTGECAGEEVMRLCADNGLDVPNVHRYTTTLYDIGLHHAALADIVSTWVKNALGCPINVPQDSKVGNHPWQATSVMAGQRLLRICLVDHASDDRLLSETRSWYSRGDIAVYDVPMDLIIVSLGNSLHGRRHSAWSKGLLHPKNKKLRFKKHERFSIDGFKESWVQIWREEHDQISRETWLKTMQDDGVLRELTKTIHIEPLTKARREETLDIIQRKAEKLSLSGQLPDPSYSMCDWPRPCPFRSVCFAPVESTPAELGFRARARELEFSDGTTQQAR